MSIKGTKTEQNLLKSFAGESQARSRYTFFASVAKKEGYEQIAGVFMAGKRAREEILQIPRRGNGRNYRQLSGRYNQYDS